MKISKSAALALICFSFTACGKTIVKTQTVEVKVPVYKKMPAELLREEPAPKRPRNDCEDAQRRPTICNKDMADWLWSYDGALKAINARMRELQGLQPKEGAKP